MKKGATRVDGSLRVMGCLAWGFHNSRVGVWVLRLRVLRSKNHCSFFYDDHDDDGSGVFFAVAPPGLFRLDVVPQTFFVIV